MNKSPRVFALGLLLVMGGETPMRHGVAWGREEVRHAKDGQRKEMGEDPK